MTSDTSGGGLAYARGTLDPGLFSPRDDAVTSFFTDLGLPFLERLEHAPDYRELMFGLPEGKLKVQSFDAPMPPSASGYTELLLARPEVREPQRRTDPDGLPITLVPVGHRAIGNVGLVCAVADVDVQRRFYIAGMAASESADGGLTIGNTRVFLEADASRTREAATPARTAGFTYITMIVHDAAGAHTGLLAAGAEPSLRLLRLADRCVFSWVRDPHGNWIEIVQYADLSGPLPDIDRIADHWDEVIEWREQGSTVA